MGELKHSVVLDQRSKAVITGVMDVSSFHENEIVLKVQDGLMVIGGEGLHVGRLSLEEGKLDVEGHVDSIVYEAPKAIGRMLRFGRKK